MITGVQQKALEVLSAILANEDLIGTYDEIVKVVWPDNSRGIIRSPLINTSPS